MKKILFIPLFTWLLTACGGNDTTKQNMGIAIRTAVAEEVENNSSRSFSFISKPYNQTELSFRVGGPVVRFDVLPGNSYKRGEVIANIDDRDFKIRQERTKALFIQAEAEYKRIAALYEKDNISGSNYEKARADFAVAKSNYETATNELSDTRLVAPFDGYVQTVHIEPHQDVRASQAVILFIELNRLKIEAYIPEQLAIKLAQDKNNKPEGYTIRFDALPGQEFSPSIIDVSKSTTANNLSYLLTATLPNPGGKLPGGMSGTISIGTNELHTLTVIPQSAVCHSSVKGDYVWVIDPDSYKVRSVPITFGNLRNAKIEVTGGLKSGDIVAMSRQSFLSDNDVVTIQQ